MSGLSDNFRGALLMIGSMAFFTFGDACIKALAGDMPLSQILVIRGVFATGFIGCLAWSFGQFTVKMPRQDWVLITIRTAGDVAAAYFFLTALFNMPLANVTALLQMLPLTVTLGGALVFREAVGWRRWTAIALGFLGMLLIVRPGSDGFTHYSILALVAVVCVTIRDLATRKLSPAAPSLMVTFIGAAGVLAFAAIWSLGQDWAPITGRSAPYLIGASLFIIGAYSFSVMVMRVGDVGFIAPFRYTGLIWALLLGWVMFGDWPQALTLLGAAIIVATGIFTLWREVEAERKTRD